MASLTAHDVGLARRSVHTHCRRLLREIGIKSCREVRFSHGGAFFAAANNAAVQVYGSYTAENVGNLRRELAKLSSG